MKKEISGEQYYNRLSINNFGGQYSIIYHGNTHPKRYQCEKWIDKFILSCKIKEFNKIAEAGKEKGFSYSLIRTLINKKARLGELKKQRIKNIVYYSVND